MWPFCRPAAACVLVSLLIQTAWFGLAQPRLESPQEVLEELAALSGEVSFAFCRLTDDGVVAEHAASADLRLALGSAFKLYLLGALAEDVASGRYKWDTVTRLDPARRSWPSGMTQKWPAGAPVTLATLATLMISISDNTATASSSIARPGPTSATRAAPSPAC